MAPPTNSIYIVQGEMNIVVMAMKRGNKWSSHAYQEVDEPLVRNFTDLKDVLNHVDDLSDLEPNQFLGPFLDVIRSGDTTGPVTGLALSSINRFLSYGLIDATGETAAAAVENITDAVTHARFVGTDPGSDEVVLMKILQVLRMLLLTPAGSLLSNESVCEIMQSCFRICFEMRLSELLRKSAENSLVDMAQLLFARLPQFREDNGVGNAFRKLKRRAGTIDTSRGKPKMKSPRQIHKRHHQQANITPKSEDAPLSSPDSGLAMPQENEMLATTPSESSKEFPDDQGSAGLDAMPSEANGTTELTPLNSGVVDMQENLQAATEKPLDGSILISPSADIGEDHEASLSAVENDFVNPRGVRFTPQQHGRDGPLIPYGLPCVRELFRFLISLINPLDKQNSDVMIHIGLNLLTVALETNADDISNFPSLLNMVKDEMCRYLIFLINSDRLALFAVALRVCFLLFESLRSHLKFQLEMYMNRLMEIIVSESPKITYEQREIVLESLVQLWRIPCLVTELYLNYDCNLYCTNLFEELTKLLSKSAFPMSGLYSTHLLSLDALLTVIDSIESHCHVKILQERQALTEQTTTKVPDSQEIGGSLRKDLSLVLSKGNDTSIDLQVASGYLHAQDILSNDRVFQHPSSPPSRKRKSRFKVIPNVPTHAELVNIKHRKKLLLTGTEQFNSKPSKGIQFLQENGILGATFDPAEVALFLKENPRLDKKMIGEYISNRKNLKVLEAFVKSFNFEDTRIDEALRMYLETFRLPGEAPVISLLMEHFADHWHKMNNCPFANSDAAFTLSYAVIMLNVDQHNHNVKKQSIPMSLEEFKKNVSGVNDKQDFDSDMLEEIYCAIRNDEIVMPAEHTGLVRENYLWKMILRRGLTKDGSFVHAHVGQFDHDLFTLIWGPSVAALSFVFDKSLEDVIIKRTISGFRKCAMIAAHYGMSDVFDHLTISLCKFTTLLSSAEAPETLPAAFGYNPKAQLAAKTVFNLAHRHGDILREGWKNVLDCLLQLYSAKLLPKALVEVEDFVDPSGKISLLREEVPAQRSETGLFSSLYSYITSSEVQQVPKGLTAEDQEFVHRAQSCINDCHPEQLISESKFLRADSLQELVKALIFASPRPDSHASHSGAYDEDATVFFLELLVEIILHNRDRVNVVWQGVRDHIYGLMMGASATEYLFLMERSVVSLLRLAVRLLWREDMTAQVLQSLRMLLLLKSSSLFRVARQTAFALHELLKSSAANIHAGEDWSTLFTLLESVGAGAKPPKILDGTIVEATDSASENGVQSDSEIGSDMTGSDISKSSERGYTSDSELYELQAAKNHPKNNHESSSNLAGVGSWIVMGKEGEIDNVQVQRPVNQYDIVLKKDFMYHDTAAFFKSCESLAFIVRDVAHITPENFESCIHCIRTFAEASLNGGKCVSDRRAKHRDAKEKKVPHRLAGRRKEDPSKMRRSISSGYVTRQVEEEDDGQTLDGGYQQASTQLLDLMHTLHTRAASIFASWENEACANKLLQTSPDTPSDNGRSLWSKCWCPLLQGIARLCCDSRRQVRTAAVTYLQRALLVHDLQALSALEWEACFNNVLFPLLLKLLANISQSDPNGVEETRMRGATLLCKVFLQHLGPLLMLSTFTALWLTILDFMDKYMHADRSDLLAEAIPELMKNMLLVMDTAGIFSSPTGPSQLWTITWDRIDAFLPSLKNDIFRSHQRGDGKTIEEPESESNASPVINQDPAGVPVEVPAQMQQSVAMNIDETANMPMPSSSSPTDAVSNVSPSLILQAAMPSEGNSSIPGTGGLHPQLSIPALHLQALSMPAANIPLIVNAEIMENSSSIQVIAQNALGHTLLDDARRNSPVGKSQR